MRYTNPVVKGLNPGVLQGVQYINSDVATEQEIYDLSSQWLKLRCDDINYVIDSLEAAVESGTLSDSWYLGDVDATDGFCTYIAGTMHMDYTDLPLFSPVLASLLGSGSLDKTECIETMNRIILEFFDCIFLSL